MSHQLSLLSRPVTDAAYRTPRPDLTPPDLLAKGWVLMPSVQPNVWVAYRQSAEGGTLRMSVEAARRCDGRG